MRSYRRRTVGRRRGLYRRPIRHTYGRYSYRRVYRRRPYYGRVRARALRTAGNHVKYTVRNNVNLFLVWPGPKPPSQDPNLPITSTNFRLSVKAIAHANRQFDRNLRDYAWVKFNYIAVKVTDVCHVGHDIVSQWGASPNQQYVASGVNGFLGSVPVNVNWDVEQDFAFLAGHEGVVDPEGFAQHPGTKTIRPYDKRKPSFVWRFPQTFRNFYSTDAVKNSPNLDQDLDTFIQGLSGNTSIRTPTKFWLSVPNFWTTLLPYTDGAPGTAVKTYVRLMVYMGVTFRGRRLMDDGTCTPTSCA